MSEQLIEAQKALDEIKNYDLSLIARRDELGQAFDFEEAVAPAQKIQSFFNRIPAELLPDLSNNFIGIIHNQALAFLNILGQMRSFDPQSEDNPSATRANVLNALNGSYETVFNNLHPAVAFVASRQRDFSSLELEARAATEAATRQAAEMADAMKANQEEAERILGEIRKVAAEQGVSQQALYFKEEADQYEKNTATWQKYTVWIAVGLAVLALASLLIALWYVPTNEYQAIQIGLSKVLLFAVVAYMLIYCARVSTANRHNAVVNRHRENALLTFNALAEASGSEANRDVILGHAAACIFAPQDTGYTKPTAQLGPSQIIDVLPRVGGAGQ